MNLADVMDDIATRVDTITGLRTFAYPPDNVPAPAAIVTYPDTYTYDETYGRGMDRVVLPVVVVVGKVSDRKSRDLIAKYCDGDGLSSIKAVIEGDGVPGWADLPGGAGNNVSSVNHATLGITGRLWLAVDLALDDWTPSAQMTLIARYGAIFNLKAYKLDVTTGGAPFVSISSTGANDLTATGGALGFTDATRHSVGIEVVPDDGGGNRTFQFYTAPTLAGPWTPHGSLITQAGAVSIANPGVALVVGSDSQGANMSAGNFYGAEVRSGDHTGTIVAHPDFTAQTPGEYAFIDDSPLGLPWILNGTAAIVAGGSAVPYTAFDTVRVQDADFDIFTMAGVDYLAATFNLDIAGEGAS
jgi:hypothetical protein